MFTMKSKQVILKMFVGNVSDSRHGSDSSGYTTLWKVALRSDVRNVKRKDE